MNFHDLCSYLLEKTQRFFFFFFLSLLKNSYLSVNAPQAVNTHQALGKRRKKRRWEKCETHLEHHQVIIMSLDLKQISQSHHPSLEIRIIHWKNKDYHEKEMMIYSGLTNSSRHNWLPDSIPKTFNFLKKSASQSNCSVRNTFPSRILWHTHHPGWSVALHFLLCCQRF